MSTQVTNEKVGKKYYAVLIQINIGKSVWLVPQKNGTLGSYKIIEFTHQELLDFEMLTDD